MLGLATIIFAHAPPVPRPQGYRCDMVSGVSIAAGFIFPFFVLFATFVMLNLVSKQKRGSEGNLADRYKS
jgi:hypothetical protein